MSDDQDLRVGPIERGKRPSRVRDTSIRGAGQQNHDLRSIGHRLRPANMDHIGSIGIHIYKNPLGSEIAVITQDACEYASRYQANFALQQAAIVIAKHYGVEPKALRKDAFASDASQASILIGLDGSPIEQPTPGFETTDPLNTTGLPVPPQVANNNESE